MTLTSIIASPSLPPSTQQILSSLPQLIANVLTGPDVNVHTVTAGAIASSLVAQGVPATLITEEYPDQCFAMIKVCGLFAHFQWLDSHINKHAYQHFKLQSQRLADENASCSTKFMRCGLLPTSPTSDQDTPPSSLALHDNLSSVIPTAACDVPCSEVLYSTLDLHSSVLDVHLSSQTSDAPGEPGTTVPELNLELYSARPCSTAKSAVEPVRASDTQHSSQPVTRRSTRLVTIKPAAPRIGSAIPHARSSLRLSRTQRVSRSKPSPSVNGSLTDESMRTDELPPIALPAGLKPAPLKKLPKLVISSSSLAALRQQTGSGSAHIMMQNSGVDAEAEGINAESGRFAKRVAGDSDDEEDEFAASFMRKRRFVQ